MASFPVPLRLTAALIAALTGAASAQAGQSGVRGVTIRGTGNTIVIERPPAPPAGSEAAPAEITVYGPIGQAVQLKKKGAPDDRVLEFLRAHAEELPSVISSSDVERLRAAGMGKSALLRLTSLAGVDIGWSWGGERPPEPETVYVAPSPEPSGAWWFGSPAYGAFGPAPRRRIFPHRPGGREGMAPFHARPRVGSLPRFRD
jgi:hypothetical protein